MIIKTNRKIWVGRTNLPALRSNTPHPVFGFVSPVRNKETGEPFFIPENTECVHFDKSHFSTKEEFIDSLEEGMFDFVLPKKLYDEFWEFVDYAIGIAHYDEDSFDFIDED